MDSKKTLLIVLFLAIPYLLSAQEKYKVSSPDNSIHVNLTVTDSISYSLYADEKELIQSSAIALHTDKDNEGSWKVSSADKGKESSTLKPEVWQKSNTIKDEYTRLLLGFENGLSLEWRAYNNGVAWRWVSGINGEYKIISEKADFNFSPGGKTWYPEEDGFYSHNERLYKQHALGSVSVDNLASLPVLAEVEDTKLLITESDLFDYAGMWVRGKGDGGLFGVHPRYPAATEETSDRDEKVVSREDYIAEINGPHSFPWRVLMVARNDNELLSNQLIYQLARPSSGDYSWVEPGKVSWDWWNANNVYEVDFRAGINTETYKYYIDFASEYGLKYIILDEGWSDTRDLLKLNPDIDMDELTRYAKQKGVGLILWTTWTTLDKQLQPALEQFVKWGIKGIKVDFMQRDDQKMVRYYEKVAKEAAKRKLLVNFHGAYKPTGWIRTYPNVLTSEGVLGNEISKFAGLVTPEHTMTIPFIRMAAGPMDFTPGGMINVHKESWSAIPTEPMTIGTRCNQLAMYVIYESPLQMLCDTPTHYYDEPETMEFLQSVPVEWVKTVPVKSEIGNYVLMARKAPNGDWYMGAMTDNNPRELSAKLSFLEEDEQYTMHIWKDGINADRNAKDFAKEVLQVNSDSEVTIKMVKAGGWVARISKFE